MDKKKGQSFFDSIVAQRAEKLTENCKEEIELLHEIIDSQKKFIDTLLNSSRDDAKLRDGMVEYVKKSSSEYKSLNHELSIAYEKIKILNKKKNAAKEIKIDLTKKIYPEFKALLYRQAEGCRFKNGTITIQNLGKFLILTIRPLNIGANFFKFNTPLKNFHNYNSL